MWYLLTISFALTFFALRNRGSILGFFAGLSWLAFAFYTRANPIGGTTSGDAVDLIVFLGSIGVAIVVPLMVMFGDLTIGQSANGGFKKWIGGRNDSLEGDDESPRGNGRESEMEYRAKIRRKMGR